MTTTTEPDWLAQTARESHAALAQADRLAETRQAPDWAAHIIDGATWLQEGPDQPRALWGDQTTLLWAAGQPLVIAGGQGTGKTVYGQRLALGWLGLTPQLLDLPVPPGPGNVLYLAADRPEQARLSMRRMVKHRHMELLAQRLRVWRGPPPHDLARTPAILTQMASAAQAHMVVLDSLKDVALKLSDDEVGASVNRAIQLAIAANIEIVSLHHPRKLAGTDRTDKPRDIDDLYGSTWLTSGAGSVIHLGRPQGQTHELTQLKSPIGACAALRYTHDTATGTVAVAHPPDLATIVTDAGEEGITTEWAACCLHQTDEPTAAQTKKTLRRLENLATTGAIVKVPSPRPGVDARWAPAH